jgi:hypothetical protein
MPAGFGSGLSRRGSRRLMTIQRMDNVGIVVDDLDAQYESIFRLCYLRGPVGIIVALAERIG